MSSLSARLQARSEGECGSLPLRPARPRPQRTTFWKRCSPERKNQLERAWRSDETRQSIADRFATSVPTLCRIARAEGWPPHQPGRRAHDWSAAELRRLERAFRRAEANQEEIARRFHIGAMTLRALARTHGWQRGSRGEVNACR